MESFGDEANSISEGEDILLFEEEEEASTLQSKDGVQETSLATSAVLVSSGISVGVEKAREDAENKSEDAPEPAGQIESRAPLPVCEGNKADTVELHPPEPTIAAAVTQKEPGAAGSSPVADGESSAEEGELVGESAADYFVFDSSTSSRQADVKPSPGARDLLHSRGSNVWPASTFGSRAGNNPPSQGYHQQASMDVGHWPMASSSGSGPAGHHQSSVMLSHQQLQPARGMAEEPYPAWVTSGQERVGPCGDPFMGWSRNPALSGNPSAPHLWNGPGGGRGPFTPPAPRAEFMPPVMAPPPPPPAPPPRRAEDNPLWQGKAPGMGPASVAPGTMPPVAPQPQPPAPLPPPRPPPPPPPPAAASAALPKPEASGPRQEAAPPQSSSLAQPADEEASRAKKKKRHKDKERHKSKDRGRDREREQRHRHRDEKLPRSEREKERSHRRDREDGLRRSDPEHRGSSKRPRELKERSSPREQSEAADRGRLGNERDLRRDPRVDADLFAGSHGDSISGLDSADAGPGVRPWDRRSHSEGRSGMRPMAEAPVAALEPSAVPGRDRFPRFRRRWHEERLAERAQHSAHALELGASPGGRGWRDGIGDRHTGGMESYPTPRRWERSAAELGWDDDERRVARCL